MVWWLVAQLLSCIRVNMAHWKLGHSKVIVLSFFFNANMTIRIILIAKIQCAFLKTVHAFWLKMRIQRERNSLLLQNSNFGVSDCHWRFTPERWFPSKSVNRSYHVDFHTGNTMAKPCITEITFTLISLIGKSSVKSLWNSRRISLHLLDKLQLSRRRLWEIRL